MFDRSNFSILHLFILCYTMWVMNFCEASQGSVLEKGSLLLKAERLFSEQLYDDALSYYNDLVFLLPEEQNALREILLYRISACHLEMNRPLKALEILLEKSSQASNQTKLYLMGRSYGKLGKLAEALEILSQISPESETALQNSKSMLALEKGFLFSQLGDFSSARTVLESIPLVKAAPQPFLLAQLRLAKNCLYVQDWEEGQKILSSLTGLTSNSPLLEKERIYLTSLLLMETDAPKKVIDCLGQLSPKELHSAPFIEMICRCYLRQVLQGNLTLSEKAKLLDHTGCLLDDLLIVNPDKKTHELVSAFYLIKSRALHDDEAYMLARDTFLHLYPAPSEEEKQLNLLKLAAAAPSYAERNRLYSELTEMKESSPIFLAKGWTLKGLNHFFEGMEHRAAYHKEAMALQFEQAIQAFGSAIALFPSEHSDERALTLKYKILTHAMQSNQVSIAAGWQTAQTLLETPQLMQALRSPDEVYSLAAWLALQTPDEKNWIAAKEALLCGTSNSPRSSVINIQLYVQLCLKLKQTIEADNMLNHLLEDRSAAETCRGQLLLLLAYSAELQGEEGRKQHYLQRAFTEDPSSPAAPIAYFHLYSYADYVWGNRHVLKHLQAMPSLFPSHPLLINAYYLIGLCQKKEQRSEEGQVLRKKNLTAAIDAFHNAEITFDGLAEEKLIPLKDVDYYMQVRQRAQLERAEANSAIARQSTGGKREIYLEYAEEVYKDLISQLNTPSSILLKIEAQFLLAQTLSEMGEIAEAEKWLEHSIQHSNAEGFTKGYWLMKTWSEKGKLLKQRGEITSALQAFLKAEASILEGKVSPDDKLDIWIEQSHCYREMQNYDASMRLLSRVINDDVISSLRIKAMYLRAEIYALQNRPELAHKQLETTARKGGEWAQKAQQKLEENYGF